MFAARWFNPRYWATRFFPKIGAAPVPVTALPPASRTYTPAAESRTFTPPAERRTWVAT